MNELKIVLNPYNSVNTVSLDGRSLSVYSELCNYMKRPFLAWANDFFKAAETEINDFFDCTVVSERFEALFLTDLCLMSDACKKIKSENFEINFLVGKRFDVVKKLADKYGIVYSVDEFKLPVSLSGFENLCSEMFKRSYDEGVFLEITDKTPATPNAYITLVVSTNRQIRRCENEKYIWEVPRDAIVEIVEAITDRFVKIPFIEKTSQKIRACKMLSSDDFELLTLATTITPILSVDNLKKLEVGESTELKVKVSPAKNALPPLRIEVDDNSVAVADGLIITALSPGETEICIFRADEAIPFAKKQITVFRQNRVQKIVLDRPEPTMGIGKTQKIDIKVFPADADDSKYVVWSVNNPNIATVNEFGEVTAIASGRVVVTASTMNQKESVIIDVMPNISKITFSDTNIQLLKGESYSVGVVCEPAKCFNNEYTCKSSNENIALAEKQIDGSILITAKEPGICTAVCSAVEGDCTERCAIEVLDPVEMEQKIKKKQTSVDIACIVGIPLAVVVILAIVAIILNAVIRG